MDLEACSPGQLEPVPASILLDHELAKRKLADKKGRIVTGCSALDNYVLLGGFERGSVVGVSAEDEELGLLLGLQMIACTLTSNTCARTMIVTTLPTAMILPKLRAALMNQLSAQGLDSLQSRVKQCLERISIARVFDIDGFKEVLKELGEAAISAETHAQELQKNAKVPGAGEPAKSHQQAVPEERERTEIPDSEEEDLCSPEPLPQEPPDIQLPPAELAQTVSSVPDIVLVAHMSNLLNALFASRDKQPAHDTMLLLSSQLHSFARSSAMNGPVFMLLNSTISPTSSSHDESIIGKGMKLSKQVEPTLCSIFNPAPQSSPLRRHHPCNVPGRFVRDPAQRNKPAFGQVFAQMVDLHLLCTRVPRTKVDAAAVAARPGGGLVEVSYTWVVEVLLDETGVLERVVADHMGDEGWVRRCREQRWAAVDVDQGRIVDAVL